MYAVEEQNKQKYNILTYKEDWYNHLQHKDSKRKLVNK